MAQFIGYLRGSRGEVSRLGGKTSGLQVTANGWNVGARVRISHEDGRDVVRVWRTGGSKDYTNAKLIAEFREGEE